MWRLPHTFISYNFLVSLSTCTIRRKLSTSIKSNVPRNFALYPESCMHRLTNYITQTTDQPTGPRDHATIWAENMKLSLETLNHLPSAVVSHDGTPINIACHFTRGLLWVVGQHFTRHLTFPSTPVTSYVISSVQLRWPFLPNDWEREREIERENRWKISRETDETGANNNRSRFCNAHYTKRTFPISRGSQAAQQLFIPL